MKKSILLLGCMLVGLVFTAQAQTELNTVWERTARTGADGAPSWFAAGYNRGLAMYDGQLFVADRTNSQIRVLDATTGADVTLDTPFDLSMVAGGTYAMNDIEASDDGYIFLGNLTVGTADTASSPNPFKLYVYNSDGGDTVSTYSFLTTDNHRLGDRFTVVGSVADNTAEIWIPAASSDPGVIYQLTTTDNGSTWDMNSLTLSGDNTSLPSNVDVEPLAAGGSDFYIAGNGSSPKKFTSAGAYIANSQFVSTSFNGSKNGFDYFEADGVEHLAVYSYRPDPANSGNKTGYVSVYNVADATAPSTVFESPLMGDDVDTFSSVYGEVKATVTADGLIFHALDGVNGLAAYTNAEPMTPANLFFSEYIEGSGNNKALEIYNPTDAEVSLNGFTIEQSSNGNDWEYYHYFPEGATIAAGDVYVIITDAVDTELFDHANADEVMGFPSPVHHNGNDARAVTFIDPIYGDTTRLDVIGDPNSSDEWDVAGVAGATGEHTLLRKASVTTGNPTPLASFGTDEASSEWVVLDQNDFSNLGEPTPLQSFEVTFQIDMNAPIDSAQFVPSEGHIVGISGSLNDWSSPGDTLFDENLDGIYTTTLTLEQGEYSYKYVTQARSAIDGYEDGDNRSLSVFKDTLLDAAQLNKTYTDLTGVELANFVVDFAIDMGVQITAGKFDPNNEEHYALLAGAPNGWASAPGENSTMSRSTADGLGLNVWEKSFVLEEQVVGAEIAYKYIMHTDGNVNWEGNVNPDPDVADRIVTLTQDLGQDEDGNYIVEAFDFDNIAFFNNLTPDQIFQGGETVTFKVDLRPAFYYLEDEGTLPDDVQTSDQSTSIDSLFTNGPLTNTQNGWAEWGEALRLRSDLKLHDDGTNGDDVAGDTVYTVQMTYEAGDARSGDFKFGINGLDNENRSGTNHQAQISGGDVIEKIFGAINLSDGTVSDNLYDEYILVTEEGVSVVRRGGTGDDDVVVSIDEITDVNTRPSEFQLKQNYPNPFNPSTNIEFTLAQSSKVTLEVYNLLGQKVMTLVDNRNMAAGQFNVSFDATNLSSGVYIYNLRAGDFTSTKKMTLIK